MQDKEIVAHIVSLMKQMGITELNPPVLTGSGAAAVADVSALNFALSMLEDMFDDMRSASSRHNQTHGAAITDKKDKKRKEKEEEASEQDVRRSERAAERKIRKEEAAENKQFTQLMVLESVILNTNYAAWQKDFDERVQIQQLAETAERQTAIFVDQKQEGRESRQSQLLDQRILAVENGDASKLRKRLKDGSVTFKNFSDEELLQHFKERNERVQKKLAERHERQRQAREEASRLRDEKFATQKLDLDQEKIDHADAYGAARRKLAEETEAFNRLTPEEKAAAIEQKLQALEKNQAAVQTVRDDFEGRITALEQRLAVNSGGGLRRTTTKPPALYQALMTEERAAHPSASRLRAPTEQNEI